MGSQDCRLWLCPELLQGLVFTPGRVSAPQLQNRLPEALLHFAECVRELLLFLLRSCLLPLLQGLAAVLQRGWQSCLDSCK